MANEKVEFDIQVNTGTSTNEIGKVRDSFNRLQQSSNDLSQKGLGQVGRFSEETTRRLTGLSSIAGDVTAAVGRLSPQLSAGAQALMSMATSAIQGGAALGPVGAGVGALTAALPFLTSALANTGRETNSLTSSLGALGTNLDDAISKLREFRREQNRLRRFASGDVTEEEATAEAQRRTTDLAQNEARFAERLRRLGGVDVPDIGFGEGLIGGLGSEESDRLMRAVRSGDRGRFERGLSAAGIELDDDRRGGLLSTFDDLVQRRQELTTALEMQAEAQQNLNEMNNEEMADAELTLGGGGRGGGGGGGSPAQAENDLARETLKIKLEQIEAERTALALQREQLEVLGRLKEKNEENAQLALDAIVERAQKLDERTAQEREDAKAEIERMRYRWSYARESEQALADLREQAADDREKLEQAALGLAEQGVEASIQIFKLSEGPQELLRAGIEAAKAFGAYPDPFGIASHTIAATMHIANAAQMGFGGSVQTPGAAPMAPSNSAVAAGPGGGNNVVIHYNAPVAEALIGRQQRRAERAATRQLARG